MANAFKCDICGGYEEGHGSGHISINDSEGKRLMRIAFFTPFENIRSKDISLQICFGCKAAFKRAIIEICRNGILSEHGWEER